MTLVEKAENFARDAHKNQLRKYNGEPYIVHPERVATRTAKYTDDEKVIAAAWLHDVVEDCQVSLKEIEEEFGFKVATVVGWLTNPSHDFPHLKRVARKEMDRHHLYSSPAEAQLIKAIDRIDNLNDIKLAKDSFKILYAKESLALAGVLTKAPASLVEELKCTVDALLGDYANEPKL
jgi:(p)ppGpp synthase/HD superfamily hydrolase